jgi:exoribonuclease R
LAEQEVFIGLVLVELLRLRRHAVSSDVVFVQEFGSNDGRVVDFLIVLAAQQKSYEFSETTLDVAPRLLEEERLE